MTGIGPCAGARACVWERVRGWTAEPAAGARGMQCPVESNGTFKETAHQQATSNQKPVEWVEAVAPRIVPLGLTLGFVASQRNKKENQSKQEDESTEEVKSGFIIL